MNKSIFKRMMSLVMAACLFASGSAGALTGQEALGLGSSTNSSGKVVYGSYPTLALGTRDVDGMVANVVMLQNRLIELGYLLGSADGQFGRLTEEAVILFQRTHGLTPTGVADSTTQAVLYSKDAQRAVLVETEKTETLRVQQKLAQWGFLGGVIDGVIGKDTQTAIAMFKHYIYDLHPSSYSAYATPAPTPAPTLAPGEMPVAEDMTMVASNILEEYNHDGELTADVMKYINGEYPFVSFERKVQKGDTGVDVERIQNRLMHLKYLYKTDGKFGDLTQYALMYFQRRNGLEQTGIADRATQELLFSEAAVMSDEYVFPYKLYVDISDQYVYVMGWTKDGYTKQVKKFICSTGMDEAPTPTGTYQAGGKVGRDDWYYFVEYHCYALHAYRIVGGIMFHSVLFTAEKEGPTKDSLSALGEKASHGCVRLKVDDAKWIVDNCPVGTTVTIQE